MPDLISQELSARGVAQVIAVLKPSRQPAAAPVALSAAVRALSAVDLGKQKRAAMSVSSSAVTALSKHFQHSEMSHDSALLRAGTIFKQTRRAQRAGRAKTPPPVRYYLNLGVMLGTVNRQGLTALRADQRVNKVVGAPQLQLIRPQRVVSAKLTQKITWGIRFLEIPELWDQGLSGKDVLVGHLDTGVDGKHPALKKDVIRHFAEFDQFGFEVTPTPKPFDTDDHGTHTAGTIAGRPVKGRAIGVAPKAELASAIVIEGGNVVARVLGGMDWTVGQGVRILSMSLGFPGFVTDFLMLSQILRDRGVLPVFAVGNEGPGTSRSPGNYAEALSVGAMDRFGDVADFSSSQRFRRKDDRIVPDLVAPGVDVVSAAPGSGFQSMDGSSMATPHVAGLAALLFEAKPEATIDEVEQAIFGSCTSDGIPSQRGNRGVPKAPRALAALTGTPTAAPRKRGAKRRATRAKKKGSRRAKIRRGTKKKIAKRARR